MGRTAVVGDEQFAHRVEHHELPEAGSSCKGDAAGRADFPGNFAGWPGFIGCSREDDVTLGESHQQPLGEFDIPLGGPFAQWHQVACVGVEQEDLFGLGAVAGLAQDRLELIELSGFWSEARGLRFESWRRGAPSGKLARIFHRGQDHLLKDLAGVQVGVVKQAVRHQIPAIRAFAEERVEADAARGLRQPGERGRGAREELHVDGRVDSERVNLPQRRERSLGEVRDGVAADRDHVFLRHEPEHVENEAVFLKYNEVDVLFAHDGDGPPDGALGENRGTLFGEFYEENFAGFLRRGGTREEQALHFVREAQHEAKRYAHPAVDGLQEGGCDEFGHKEESQITLKTEAQALSRSNFLSARRWGAVIGTASSSARGNQPWFSARKSGVVPGKTERLTRWCVNG